MPAVIDHLTDVVGGLQQPPILMGHSAGGVFTQLMLDRGYGAVGVAINSAATEGVTEVKEYPGYAHLLPAQKGWERSPTTPWPGP